MKEVAGRSEGTFAAAFRAAIEARGVTLSALHRRLGERGNPVAMATLSYWRSGARQPEGAASLSAVDEIEVLLELARGSLADLIPSASRRRRAPEARPAFNEEQLERDIAEVARELHTVAQVDIWDLSSDVIAHVDANGDLERVVTRSLVEAAGAALTEIPLYDIVTDDATVLKQLERTRGCRLDRSLRREGARVACDVVVLDSPLKQGETTLIEFTERVPEGFADRRSVWHGLSRASRQVLIWVHFHPDALPDWCEEYTQTDDGETVRMLRLLGGSVHAYRFGFGPGVLGVRWGYDAD